MWGEAADAGGCAEVAGAEGMYQGDDEVEAKCADGCVSSFFALPVTIGGS